MRYTNINAFVIPRAILTTYTSLSLHHYSISRIKVTDCLASYTFLIKEDKINIPHRHIQDLKHTYWMMLHHFRQQIPALILSEWGYGGGGQGNIERCNRGKINLSG